MKRIPLLNIICLLLASLLVPSYSFATFSSDNDNVTKFPNCPDPGGTQVAGYDEGWHWIVGETQLKWGSDYVYHLGDTRYVQCYCEIEGNNNGIQTNWLPASLVSSNKQAKLISQGWILVQNGADFGLPNASYLAQNSRFSCKPKNECKTSPYVPNGDKLNSLLDKLNNKLDKKLDKITDITDNIPNP